MNIVKTSFIAAALLALAGCIIAPEPGYKRDQGYGYHQGDNHGGGDRDGGGRDRHDFQR